MRGERRVTGGALVVAFVLTGCIGEMGVSSSVERFTVAPSASNQMTMAAPGSSSESSLYMDTAIRMSHLALMLGVTMMVQTPRTVGEPIYPLENLAGGFRIYTGAGVPVRFGTFAVMPYVFASTGQADNLAGGGVEFALQSSKGFLGNNGFAGLALRVAGFEGLGAGALVSVGFRMDFSNSFSHGDGDDR